MVLKIVPREEWGAEEPRIRRMLVTPVENVAEDHWVPVTINKYELWEPCNTQDECSERCRLIQKMAFEKKLSDIQYSFLIGGDGKVYEGRGWHALVPETWKWSGLNIGYIGRYTKENPPPEHMQQVFHEMLDYGKKRFYIKEDAYILHGFDQWGQFEENPHPEYG